MGEGFDLDQRDIFAYDRLVCNTLQWHHTNIAKGGSGNHEIFMRSAVSLMQDYDVLFVQWSALNRIWFYPGPNCEWFMNDGLDEFRYRDVYLNRTNKKKFTENLLIMNHDYHNIFELVDYCSILDRLAAYHDKIVVYINGLVPWTDDLSRNLGNDLDRELSPYTKNILDFQYRDDRDILEFINSLRKKFSELDQSRWVNLFDSFQKSSVDVGPQGHHPGPKSHAIMSEKIIRYVQCNNII